MVVFCVVFSFLALMIVLHNLDEIVEFFTSIFKCYKARKTMLNKWFRIGKNGAEGLFLVEELPYQTSSPAMYGYYFSFSRRVFSKTKMYLWEATEVLAESELIESCNKALACHIEQARAQEEASANEEKRRNEERRKEVDEKILSLPNVVCKTKKLKE